MRQCMSQDNEYKKKIRIVKNDENAEEDEGGKGGQGSQVAFRTFIAMGDSLRDDLPGEEKRRLRSIHEGVHEAVVEKQKNTSDQYKQLKEGKISLEAYRQGKGISDYKNHPLLSNKAQFSGIDRQVNALPTENVAETNNELAAELKYRYNLVHRPQEALRFNPKLHR